MNDAGKMADILGSKALGGIFEKKIEIPVSIVEVRQNTNRNRPAIVKLFDYTKNATFEGMSSFRGQQNNNFKHDHS